MRKYVRSLIALTLGIAFATLAATEAMAGPFPYFTGPQDPSQIQFYLNALVNQINQSSTFAGTGTPVSGAIGVSWLSAIGTTTPGLTLQLMTSSELTGVGTRLTTTVPSGWIEFLNFSGTPIYIPFQY